LHCCGPRQVRGQDRDAGVMTGLTTGSLPGELRFLTGRPARRRAKRVYDSTPILYTPHAGRHLAAPLSSLINSRRSAVSPRKLLALGWRLFPIVLLIPMCWTNDGLWQYSR
jgi:hypothetical protein